MQTRAEANVVDVVKSVAIVGSAVYAVEKMLRVFRLWRATSKPEKPGLTIRNGEYLQLVESLGRIEMREDHAAMALKAVERRVAMIEERLAS
jgi:hypothetical protein